MTHGWAPKCAHPELSWPPRETPTSLSCLPRDPHLILCPLFQEEVKEEQTAMVPQAIPLRRCGYCMVLVGDAGTSVGGLRQGQDFLASPPSSRKASQMPALTSHPHCWA